MQILSPLFTLRRLPLLFSVVCAVVVMRDCAGYAPLPAVPPLGVFVRGTVSGGIQWNYANGELELERVFVESETGWKSWPAGILVRFRDLQQFFVQGDQIEVFCNLDAPLPKLNPGTRDWARDLQRRGVGSVCTLPAAAEIRKIRAARGLFRWIAQGESVAQAAFLRWVPGRAGPLLATMTLADARGLDPAIRTQFAAAGVAHVLAVSGLNFTILAAVLIWLLRPLALRCTFWTRRFDVRQLLVPPVVAALWVFVAMIGAPVPAVRSAAMASAVMAGWMLVEEIGVLDGLWFAGIVILICSRSQLFSPSFQLSMAATWFLIRFSGDAENSRILPRPPSRFERFTKATFGLWRATLAGTLGTFAIVLFHFHRVQLAGLLTNLIVVPVFSVILLPVSYVLLVLAWFSRTLDHPAVLEWIGGAVGQVLRFTVEGILKITALGEALHQRTPWLGTHWFYPEGFTAIALFVLTYAALTTTSWKNRGMLISLAIGSCCLDFAWSYGLPVLRSETSLSYISIGEGDAAFLRYRGKTNVLIDSGGNLFGNQTVGEKLLVPYLRNRGVRKLDLVVLTHPHPDHFGGLVQLAPQIPVGELWHNGILPENAEFIAALEIMRSAGTRIRTMYETEGPVAVPGSRGQLVFEVLHPPAELAPRDGGPAPLPGNDFSIVLRFALGRTRFLMTGDVEERAETVLLDHDLHADVLKIPHHGSSTSSHDFFLQAVAPRVAVISVGRDNPFDFPRRDVLERLRHNKIEVLRTDECGEIRFSDHSEIPTTFLPCLNSTGRGP